MDGLTLSLLDAGADAEVQAVFAGLMAFNAERCRPYDKRDLVVAAHTADGALAGGLVGMTNWEWLYVDSLWVADDRQRGGLGARLLRAAEEEAVRRGCRWSRLWTYDFQAPDFYPRQGYERWAVLDGYPPGHSQIWFRKELVP
ncbi:MAG TPA: GNAT family N-acetyltransferase [Azospirillum sp.]|nr:GNAT family N-acetyltransferase [Azospirillum sp.]